MLVRKEEHPLAAFEGPLEGLAGIRGSADQTAVATGEGLDVGRAVHVGHGHGARGNPGLFERVPGLGDLLGGGHVGHRASGPEVGQDDGLAVCGEDVGALGHEVDAAEDDEFRCGPVSGGLRQLEGVSGHIGELDDLVALVVVAKDEGAIAERRPSGASPLHQGRVGGRGQLTRAVDPALGTRVGLASEQEKRLSEGTLRSGGIAAQARYSWGGQVDSHGNSLAGPSDGRFDYNSRCMRLHGRPPVAAC